MTEVSEATTSTSAELLASGRRHLAIRDYSSAVDVLAKACESYVTEFGENAEECADVYLWYGKALLGLSREESGVLGDGMPGTNNEQDDDDDNEGQDEAGDNEESNDAEAKTGDVKDNEAESSEAQTEAHVEKSEAESTTKDEAVATSSNGESSAQAGPSGGDNDGAGDESDDEDENDEDVDNLQLAWEMLELSRNIFLRRVSGGASASRNQLAEVHLALGEVALESETYDKACVEMMSCLEIQKELYGNDDRRIAETHYQIGLANSLASNFDEAITHFKNAANILESRVKTLQDSSESADKAVEAEIKEIKELLPEIHDKIQDMIEYKAETKKRVQETLFPSNGSNGEASSSSAFTSNGVASSSTSSAKPAASNISHLIKRKRKSSTGEEASAPKKANT